MKDDINTDTKKLNNRIETHNKYSKYDIDKWIFDILNVKKSESIIDLGCGTGKQVIPLTKKTKGLIVGIDINEESLNSIKKTVGELSNLKLIHSSIEEFYGKVKDLGEFDLIISCFAVYYSKEPKKTLLDLKSLLKEGGRLFLCGPNLDNNNALLELHGKIAKLPKMYKGFFENLAIPFLKENFSSVDVFNFENPIEFPDVDELAKYWLSYKIGDENKISEFKEAAKSMFENGKFTTVKCVIGILATK